MKQVLELIFILALIKETLNQVTDFKYEYSDQKGWKNVDYQCDGYYQSPIHLKLKDALFRKIPALKMFGYDEPLQGPIVVQNNEKTVSISLQSKTKVPYITGAYLPNGKFELASLHFHWGKKEDRGSEHWINGKSYSLELHLVHINEKYNRNQNLAMGKPDGIAVLGILYQFSETESQSLQPIVKLLDYVINPDNQKVVKKPSFSLRSLFSELDTTSFFRYTGSLTTPPCSEHVQWIVFSTPLPKVTNNQLNEFRKLKKRDGSNICDNYRELQPVHFRRIYFREKQRK